MRRVRVFAAPFVLTAALSGCEDHTRAHEPRREVRPDAQLAINPPQPVPDAMMSHNPPMPVPDAAPLAEAPAGVTTVLTSSGCKVFPSTGEGAIACPAGGATITVASSVLRNGSASYDELNMECNEPGESHCPPPGQGTCNPPAPNTVPCPADLLPTLRADLEPVRDGDHCSWHVDDLHDIEVACPAKLADPPKGARVYEQDGACHVADAASPVACPKGGAAFSIPSTLSLGSVWLQPSSMTCFEVRSSDCPPGTTHTCNPPPPAQVACPDELMPTLRAGVKPDRHGGKCTYQHIQVRCP